MGRGFFEYSYLDVDLPDERVLYSAFLDYILEDDVRLHVEQDGCYCPVCKHFVVGERINSITEIEHQIDQIENNPESDLYKAAVFAGDILKQIDELHLRIKWRQQRQSPPKCLYCGSTDIIALPWQEEFNHPGNGYRMKLSDRGFSDAAPWHATYTPEGDQISSNE